MRRLVKKFTCVLLAAGMLAGCGSTASESSADTTSISASNVPSSIASDSEIPAVDIAQIDPTLSHYEAYRNAEPWQLAFYEIVKSTSPQNLSLFVAEDGTPILTQHGQQYQVVIWKYEDDAADAVYVGEAIKVFYNNTNGNLVLWGRTDKEDTTIFTQYIEINGDDEDVLCETDSDNNIYLYTENRWLSIAEAFEWDPYESLDISDAQKTLPSSDQARLDESWNQRLLRFFFGIETEPIEVYSPPVPAEAPEWISIYLKAIHGSSAVAAAQGGPVNYYSPFSAASEEIKLLEPVYPGGPPVLYASGFGDGTIGYYFIFNGQVEYYYDISGGEAWRDLYADDGRFLVCHGIWSQKTWYSIDENGLHKLFMSNRPSAGANGPSGYAYCDGNLLEVDANAYGEDDGWMEDQTQQALIRRGYSGNYSAPKETVYPLSESLTWAELEAALIDILCTHAQKIGQWG